MADVAQRRVVRLRVIGGATLELRDDVPSSRAECPKVRPCGHVRCRYHLWTVEGHDRRGRRVEGRTPTTTLRPAWLEWPMPPSCSLDVALATWHVEKIATAIGLRPSQFRAHVAAALVKLRDAGLSLREFLGDVA